MRIYDNLVNMSGYEDQVKRIARLEAQCANLKSIVSDIEVELTLYEFGRRCDHCGKFSKYIDPLQHEDGCLWIRAKTALAQMGEGGSECTPEAEK